MNKLFAFVVTCFFLSCSYAQNNPVYEVYAITFARAPGYVHERDMALNPPVKDSTKVVFMTWLLKGNNGKTILVDAGFQRSGKFFAPGFMDYTRPDSSLMLLGVKPEDITDIIITHPHWDHVGGIDLFPNARIWMQREDYRYLVVDMWQKDGKRMGIDSSDVLKIVDLNTRGRVQLVNGDDVEIMPGIRAYIGSKHTYESQYVVVNTATDKVLVASDNSWFYYNLDHLASIALTFDENAYVRNLQRMKTLVKPGLIIPGHDAQVLERFTKVKEGVVRIR
ncbi:MAG TPA: N-acyl homoserine lactonase family protein [Chitinophagaceae bacterium]|nr:N-acyl homoserine lactonase family protein [Chitinophagaceae bacterium]